jgi:hypothetical protein
VALFLACGCKHGNASQGTAAGTANNPPANNVAANQPKPAQAGPDYHFVKPDHVRGIYLTAWSAGSKKKMAKMMDLMDTTELNAVVIDVRDTGEMYWDTGIPFAQDVRANEHAVPHPEVVFEQLAKHNVWPIARIACFRDDFVPKKYPNRCVQFANGTAWHDRSNHHWLDPYNKDNWQYIADTVEWALKVGFPEIQLDYVRFPSEGKSSTQVFPGKKKYDDPKAKPEDVIAAFCHFIRDKVKSKNAVLSADIFGIISSTKGDEGIGQELEKVAEPFDVMSPMVYPSHFAKGEYGIPDPNLAPYDILKKSFADYKRRLPNKVIRPWLQDFSLRGVHYGIPQVLAQIKAAHEAGYDDFLMWNAGNHYTEGAYTQIKDTAKK